MKKEKSIGVFYALVVAMQLGLFIMLPIVGFLFLGIWMDKSFGLSPLFLVIGLVVGFVITVYETYHMLRPFLIKNKDA